MKKNRTVIALGGNALGANLPEQMVSVRHISKVIVDLVQDGCDVVICHGNGPQVGMIMDAMALLTRQHPETFVPCPLSVCTAMSQGYIGYDLQNAIREELLNREIPRDVTTVLTEVVVDEKDPAFQNPTKPIGTFMTKEEADRMVAQRDYRVTEDAGRGYRRVVASPMPREIVQLSTIRDLVETGHIVVAGGGGGIPVMLQKDNHLKGAAAVVDKDYSAELLAEKLDADTLILLTAVEKAAINFGKPDQKWLDFMTPEKAEEYAEEKQFAEGSMLPKIKAAVMFARSKRGRTALITSLERADDGLHGKTGTVIRE
jgi:carbamate kinase